MEYRTFGNTDLTVSAVGFGAWAIGGPLELGGNPVGWSRVEESTAIEALHRSFDLGVNFFDTADVYGLGHSEMLIGKAFCGRRARVIIASKVGNEILTTGGHRKNFGPDYIEKSLHATLKRLQTDYLDLYQMHNPSLAIIRQGTVFQTLDRLKEQGKIRYYGVSINTPEEGLEVVRMGAGQGLQVLYNALNQKPAERLFPAARRAGYGIIARVPLASGLLSGRMTPETRFEADDIRGNFLTTRRLREALEKVELFKHLAGISGAEVAKASLAFVLTNPAVSVAIPGARNAAQAEANAGAVDYRLPDRVVENVRKELGGYNFYLRYAIPV